MANVKSRDYALPQHFNDAGGPDTWISKADIKVAADLATGSTIKFPLPAGVLVYDLALQMPDLDTAAALVFSVGYAPHDSSSPLAASPAYFAAAGQTTGQAGGRLRCAFAPIQFDEPVDVVITVGTQPAGLPAAGVIYAITSGVCTGSK